MGWPGSCFGHDVDNVLAYRTKRLVVIHDHRLGCLNCAFILSILCYIVLFEMLYETKYLDVSAPVGGVRFSLLESTTKLGCEPAEGEAGCFAVLPEKNRTAYCVESSEPYAYTKRNCTFRDGLDALTATGNECFVATRLVHTKQQKACNGLENTCSLLWQNGQEDTSYVAGVEQYTLLVDHAFRDSFGEENNVVSGISKTMKGFLFVPRNGEMCKAQQSKGRGVTSDKYGKNPTDTAPCYISTGNPEADGLDVFTVKEWLASGDLDLDQALGDPSKPTESVRGRGHVVVLDIEYSNIHHWTGAHDEVTYVYKVSFLPGSSFQQTSVESDGAERTLTKEYGIKITVVLTGQLGRFSFNTLLLQFAAGFALFKLARHLTDFLAMYVLPEKKLYKKNILRETIDYSDYRDGIVDQKQEGREETQKQQQQQQQQQHNEQTNSFNYLPYPTNDSINYPPANA